MSDSMLKAQEATIYACHEGQATAREARELLRDGIRKCHRPCMEKGGDCQCWCDAARALLKRGEQ